MKINKKFIISLKIITLDFVNIIKSKVWNQRVKNQMFQLEETHYPSLSL